MQARESFDISPPREEYPYEPPPELIEHDIRELLKDLPGVKYGSLGGLPVIYWDREICRFCIFPHLRLEKMSSVLRIEKEFVIVHALGGVVYTVKLDGVEETFYGMPCLVIGETYGFVKTEEGGIHPVVLTPFYGEAYNLYFTFNDVVDGKAEFLAMVNFARCILGGLEMLAREKQPLPQPPDKLLRRALVSKTELPVDVIQSQIEKGFCITSRNPYLFIEHSGIGTRVPEYALENLYYYLLVRDKLDKFHPYISLKDYCESGKNKIYSATIFGMMLASILGGLCWNLARRIVEEINKQVGRNLAYYMFGKIRELESFGLKYPVTTVTDMIIEAFEKYAKISVSEYEAYRVRSFVQSFVKADALISIISELIKDSCNRTTIHEKIRARIDELYDVPIHALQEMYVREDDYVALAILETLTTSLYTYILDAGEIIKEKFGYGYAPTPQRLR